MKFIPIVTVTMLAMVASAPAHAQTFGGYGCTEDCSGHSAGYKWAQDHDMSDPSTCPEGDSQSFHEGCMAYGEGSVTDPDEDDDGNDIGD